MTNHRHACRTVFLVVLSGMGILLGAWGSSSAADRALQHAAGRVTGVVVDQRTETPLARVQVRLVELDRATTTGSDGRFEFAGVPAGEHTLAASIVGYAVVRRTFVLASSAVLTFTIVLTAGVDTYVERVEVVAPVFETPEPGALAAQTILASEIQDLRGMVADDPMRAVQALPGVTAGDDFSAEFSARGSGPAHTNIVLDGIPAAPVLLHAIEGRDDTGSIARISSDVLARATLQLGASPQRYGDRLGPQLDFVSRDGSRDAVHVRALVSTVAAGGIAEGPIAGGRGAWLATVRQSYLDWVVRRIDPDNTSWLGFTDAFAKATFDLTPRHQVRLSLLGGRAHYEEEGVTSTNGLHTARSRGGMATLELRSTGADWVLNQRAFTLLNRFRNQRVDGYELGWGRHAESGYRAELTKVWPPRLTLDAGGHAQYRGAQLHVWTLDRRVPPRRTPVENVGVAVAHGGLFGQVRWLARETTTVTAGTRADATSAIDGIAVSPWVQVEKRMGHGLALRAATALVHQAPSEEQIFGVHGGRGALGAQRAWHADAGVEQRLGVRMRWQLGVFNREERDLAWAPGLEVRGPGALVPYNSKAIYQNRLEGYARGIEFLAQRRDPNGLSGWFAYAWARSHYTDPATGESFDGDYDQRHTINAYVSLRLWTYTTVIGKYRRGSNIPMRGYYQATGVIDDEGLPVFGAGPARNAARLPTYARADLRINQALPIGSRRLTLFVELINVFDRTNAGLAGGRWVEELLPFIPAAGCLVEF